MSNHQLPANLGWQPFFQQQLSLDEWEESIPVRIIEQYRSEITISTGENTLNLPLLPSMPEMVVGDWILLNKENRFKRLLERKTCFQRKASGTKLKEQLISANVDTAFIVSSMNDDFNLNRIERFLALVNEAGAEPVILLSKSDLAESPQDFIEQIQSLHGFISVESVNCLSRDSLLTLQPWLNQGSTIAVLGSSGVGKSTLVNTLLGKEQQTTSGIREADSKGRHTTTNRSLITLKDGCLILDTPGMREIQLADCKDGIATTFKDIEALAAQCQFSDCQHQQEPNCSVLNAIEAGELEQRRLDNYLKLQREESRNSASLSERRAIDKAFGKFYKRTLEQSKRLKGQ